MTDQKKYTLEDDLREAAGWLSLSGPKQAPLRDRLYKWAEGIDPNEQPFDFQRSYDRGVRRFVMRNGSVTSEVHWFKDSESINPVRDADGNVWTAEGRLYCADEDLIAEAPAEVQPEDAA